MITRKLSSTQNLCVSSSWDTGTHTGLHVGVSGEMGYDCTSLDKVLSKEQINGLEAIVLHYVGMYIEDNKRKVL